MKYALIIWLATSLLTCVSRNMRRKREKEEKK